MFKNVYVVLYLIENSGECLRVFENENEAITYRDELPKSRYIETVKFIPTLKD